MHRSILAIRLGTLESFLNKIRLATSERARLDIATEASRLADKIKDRTPLESFSPLEAEKIELGLEHYSLAVFCDHIDWAQNTLDELRTITCEYF
jgi:hypothetical protein